MLRDKRGFSLIELMMVVAIIATLTMLALPAFDRMQTRARQKAGFNMLNTFYSTAQSTYLEYGSYPGNLVAMGFQPQGEVDYRLASLDNALFPAGLIPAGATDSNCLDTGGACDCGGACPDYRTWSETLGQVGIRLGPAECGVNVAGCGAHALDATSFNVFACGIINLKATTLDQYAIDQNKTIRMCFDGQ